MPIVAIDVDPLATLLSRAALAVVGQGTYNVVNADYTTVQIAPVTGRTAFLGNPPYVRHHNLPGDLKNWGRSTASGLGRRISGLAGLHAYFFLATALHGRRDDVGSFVTSAEWLDVNYGSIIRELLLDRLGALSIHYIEPKSMPFGDAATTAAITCFRIGDRPRSIRLGRVKRIADLGTLGGGRSTSCERLQGTSRWTTLIGKRPTHREGYVELGELCRVHRGAVTGANSTWITAASDTSLPEAVLFPAITKARELFSAGEALADAQTLRRVIDLPEDLDQLSEEERRLVESFLQRAKKAGVDGGYIARSRRAWWSVKLREPAPILATYMARRLPAFVRNLAGARHINIAHGIYPRIELPPRALDRLAGSLRSTTTLAEGRTYAGGLTKFEPREMERLYVPDLPALLAP